VVVDFTNYAGETLILRNNARSPFPKGDVVNPRTAGRIMAFRVSPEPVEDPSDLPDYLRSEPILPLEPTEEDPYELILFEGEDMYGRLEPMLGTVAEGKKFWDDDITENPMLDDIAIWTVYNTTEDAHPVHLHLVAFQIIDRQKFRADQDPETGALTNIRLIGKPKPPKANEDGWKDTAQMYPGEVTRVIAKFDREGRYVWHCHILSHEDHEMMRPYHIGEIPSVDLLKGVKKINPMRHQF
jgi:spore coat protein A